MTISILESEQKKNEREEMIKDIIQGLKAVSFQIENYHQMLSLVNTRNLTNIHHHGIFFKYQGKRKDPKLRNWYVHWPESQNESDIPKINTGGLKAIVMYLKF